MNLGNSESFAELNTPIPIARKNTIKATKNSFRAS